jgi:hypothetical protein
VCTDSRRQSVGLVLCGQTCVEQEQVLFTGWLHTRMARGEVFTPQEPADASEGASGASKVHTRFDKRVHCMVTAQTLGREGERGWGAALSHRTVLITSAHCALAQNGLSTQNGFRLAAENKRRAFAS